MREQPRKRKFNSTEVPIMKYTQNEKILQIKDSTLIIIGIDIASQTHYARAFDNRDIEYGKVLKFDNDAGGFSEFQVGDSPYGAESKAGSYCWNGAHWSLLVRNRPIS